MFHHVQPSGSLGKGTPGQDHADLARDRQWGSGPARLGHVEPGEAAIWATALDEKAGGSRRPDAHGDPAPELDHGVKRPGVLDRIGVRQLVTDRLVSVDATAGD